MQAKDTIRLARKIRRIRERKIRGKLTPWRVVCEKLGIRTEEGKLDHGMAYKIGYDEYEPSGREVRKRLGLRDICTKCKRAYRVPRAQVSRVLSPARAWWNSLKGEERDRVIEFAYNQMMKWRNKK